MRSKSLDQQDVLDDLKGFDVGNGALLGTRVNTSAEGDAGGCPVIIDGDEYLGSKGHGRFLKRGTNQMLI